MRKVLIAGIIFGVATLFGGCGNSAYNKFMEEGKLALANEEYDKAQNMFTLANDEKDGESKEATNLIKQIDLYIEINELAERKELMTSSYIDTIIQLCEEVEDIETEISHIKSKVSSLKEDFENSKIEVVKTEEYIESGITEIEKIIDEGRYQDARDIGNNLFWEVRSYPENFQHYTEKLQELIDKAVELRDGEYLDIDSILNENPVEWDPSWSTKPTGYDGN